MGRKQTDWPKPFDGAVSRYVADEAPKEIRKALAGRRQGRHPRLALSVPRAARRRRLRGGLRGVPARARQAAALAARRGQAHRRGVRGPRRRRQGRHHPRLHREPEPALDARRRASGAVGRRARPVVLPALHRPPAEPRRDGAVRPLLVQPRHRRARLRLVHRGRARALLRPAARVRGHAGARRHRPDQDLAGDRPGRAAPPVPAARERSAEAVEAQPDRHRRPVALARLHRRDRARPSPSATCRSRRGR